MRVVVVGVGNVERGDDGAGPEAALLLSRRLPPAVEVRIVAGDPGEVLQAIEGADAAILVDAMSAGAGRGRLARLDAARIPLPAEMFASSTHGLGLAHAVELARALGRLPAMTVVYGIEGRDFRLGAGLSGPVREAVDEAVARIAAEVESLDTVPA